MTYLVNKLADLPTAALLAIFVLALIGIYFWGMFIAEHVWQISTRDKYKEDK